MTPFEKLVSDLRVESSFQDRRAVFLKAMPVRPTDVLHARRVAQGKEDDQRIASARLDTMRRGAGKNRRTEDLPYDPAKMIRALIDADHARRLRDGDMDRASRAIELGVAIPPDVLARINGGAK